MVLTKYMYVQTAQCWLSILHNIGLKIDTSSLIEMIDRFTTTLQGYPSFEWCLADWYCYLSDSLFHFDHFSYVYPLSTGRLHQMWEPWTCSLFCWIQTGAILCGTAFQKCSTGPCWWMNWWQCQFWQWHTTHWQSWCQTEIYE